MRRAAFLLLLLAAAPAARAAEGGYLTIDGGYALWNTGTLKQRLTPQVGVDNAALLADHELVDGGVFALHAGYNIGGHVAIEGSFMAHPWKVASADRGGVGFAGFGVRWFPMEGLLRSNRWFDLSLLAGVDYFLMGSFGAIPPGGSSPAKNTGRGFDGLAYEFGGTLEVYPAKWFSIGVTPRIYELQPQRYFTNYGNRDQGGQIPLDGNVGGSLFSICLSITFHFSSMPD